MNHNIILQLGIRIFADCCNNRYFCALLELPSADTNVIINGCDTGVPSLLFPDGSTLSDMIYQMAAEANNHGQFVGGVAQLKNQLRKEALLTAAQAATIQECAARSSLP